MEKQKIRQVILPFVVISALLWLGLYFLGPVLLPFALGLLIAWSADPLVARLQKQLKFPRWLCAGISVTGIYLAVSLACFVLCRLLWKELASFVQALPELAASLSGPAQAMERRLLLLAGRFPDGIGKALENGISEFFRSGAGLTEKIYTGLFDFVTALLKKLPDVSLFFLTAVLSGFMLAAKLPRLRQLWKQKIPQKWQTRTEMLGTRLKATLGNWFKAQAKLMGLCALILTTGFLILGIAYPLLFGLVIALVDALPALGTGLILIPWAVVAYLQGNSFLGTGLLLLYGVAALLRTALEPRLLGKQMGLDPLLTLLSLYAGYRFLGLPGMILFPISAIMMKQFWSYMETGRAN